MVASTNAVVSGLQVVQALHVLKWKAERQTEGVQLSDDKREQLKTLLKHGVKHVRVCFVYSNCLAYLLLCSNMIM